MQPSKGAQDHHLANIVIAVVCMFCARARACVCVCVCACARACVSVSLPCSCFTDNCRNNFGAFLVSLTIVSLATNTVGNI
jgi:hypothetical protein